VREKDLVGPEALDIERRAAHLTRRPGREFGLREAWWSGVAMRLHDLVVVETVSFVIKKLGSTTP